MIGPVALVIFLLTGYGFAKTEVLNLLLGHVERREGGGSNVNEAWGP